MISEETPDPSGQTFLREGDLAQRWGKSTRTLQRWRAIKYGPPYILLRGSVRYPVSDVLAFEASVRRGGGAAE